MTWFSFHFSDFSVSFNSLLFEGVPFLLLGALISGIVDVFVPTRWITGMLPKNRTAAVCLSGLLGGIFPMCECGSVVVIRRFLAKGLPVSCAVAYMLGAPIVSPLVAGVTFWAFQGQNPWSMTILRVSIGYLVAVGAGLFVQRMRVENVLQPGLLAALRAGAPGSFSGAGVAAESRIATVASSPVRSATPSAQSPRRRSGLTIVSGAMPQTEADMEGWEGLIESPSLKMKLRRLLRTATSDFLDVAFFFVIGAAIAAVFNTAIRQEVILPLATNGVLATLSMMVLSGVLALCSTTDAFIAASFVAFPFTAKLAFLLFGPVFDVKLFFLYGMVFRRKFVVLLSLGLFIAIALICLRMSGLDA